MSSRLSGGGIPTLRLETVQITRRRIGQSIGQCPTFEIQSPVEVKPLLMRDHPCSSALEACLMCGEDRLLWTRIGLLRVQSGNDLKVFQIERVKTGSPRKGHGGSGLIEVDFGSYPSGQSLAWTLTARTGDDRLARKLHHLEDMSPTVLRPRAAKRRLRSERSAANRR